ncbi:MAG: tRNA (N(6)-L-threonylcarbamoyladenosine(37)-C(2))-methylthiotransferase MtaB [Defluviitaleaceae bacterium]|nr:tRNA (N(6)-L-threonylcarbamoyladenosine(37)-C(2))-methylthiotransferase MtaB [Defluviitaleaceae bacterium]
MTVAIHTLGCKVNQYDSEALLTKLVSAGYEVVRFNQTADIYIINSCTVTHTSDKKSMQMLRRARRLNTTAFIAVCGCMPQSNTDIYMKITEAGADFIFDARKPDDLLTKLEITDLHKAPTVITDRRNRAFIKIQDGCERYCAYCIVPYVRGPVTSRPADVILDEVKTHVPRDTGEIVLTGIQVAAYGYDTGSEYINLPKLIREIDRSNPGIRLRLSSIDPWAIDTAFLETVADSPTLCSHFHLSLQSGSDNILHSMNRQYTTAEYAKVAKNLRILRPEMALTTDIIVGFPGETDEDFNKSLQFAKEMAFAQIHVFEYSPRAGTKAASLPSPVPEKIKTARGQEMRALAASLKQSFLQKQVGMTVSVLMETPSQGHTKNYCMVHVKGIHQQNTIKNVLITDATDNELVGELT